MPETRKLHQPQFRSTSDMHATESGWCFTWRVISVRVSHSSIYFKSKIHVKFTCRSAYCLA